MKITKLTVLLLLLIAATSVLRAQCDLFTEYNTHSRDVYFRGYPPDYTTGPYTCWWDFGDGDTTHAQFPVHTYAANGTYIACFNFSSANCPLSTVCDTVVVDLCDYNPVISAEVSGYTATFTGYSVPAGSTYFWQFNTPGGTQTSTDINPLVDYGQYGIYDVHLTITAPNGCVDSADGQATVFTPCNANFSYEQTGLYEITFHAEDSLNVGSYIQFTWSFANGTRGNIAEWTYNYPDSVTDHVCVSVIDTGCATTVCHDVVVSPPSVPVHWITGNISKGVNTACSAVIYLISDSAGFLTLANVTHTVDSLGACDGFYYFANIPQGEYYMKAALDSADPGYADYLPTYFGGELNWADATAIQLDSTTEVDITLTAGVNPGGPGFVGGWVFEGAGLTIGSNTESRAAGDALKGIQINLLTDADVPVAATYTDANGRYTFSNLALGTYKVYAEQINKVPYPLTVVIDANNPLQDNVNVTVNSNSAVTGVDDILDLRITGVSPNPVTDKTNISIALKQSSKAVLMLTDINGRFIQSRNLELVAGNNQIKLDLSEQASGIYFLNLTNEASKKIIKLTKVN